MSSDGPTGGMINPLDLLYMLSNATGPTGLMMTPTAPVGPPPIPSLEELMASHGAIANKEVADKAALAVLLNQNRDTLGPPLFQWAAAGFQPIYVVQSFTIIAPAVCSDGGKRSLYEYIEYCLGMDMASVIATVQGSVAGIEFSYSIVGNTLNIHVTKRS